MNKFVIQIHFLAVIKLIPKISKKHLKKLLFVIFKNPQANKRI